MDGRLTGRADLPVPDGVTWIARKLEDAGHSTWVVGGAVRDALTGLDPEDWDLTTAAHPREVQRIFRRTAPIGIAHGTVGVITKGGRMYEVTTFRRDVETFGRHARVAFADTLEDDLSRRDFTINAVAWHPISHEVRDPHQGMLDLERRVLRTVGEPALRFEEDRLRALRALRFAGRFDLEIDPRTWQAIIDCSAQLGSLSAERVREELLKVFVGKAPPSRTLQLYADSGVLGALYPELASLCGSGAGEDDLWGYTLRAVDALPRHRPILRMAALLHAAGSAGNEDASPAGQIDATAASRSAAIARELLRRLKFSNAETDLITHLLAHQAPRPTAEDDEPAVRRWVRGVGRDYVNDLFRLLFASARAKEPTAGPLAGSLLRLRSRAAAVLRSGIPLTIGELAIDGGDLRALGIAPGPLYSEIFRDALERVIDGLLPNRRDALLAYIASSTHPLS